MWATSLHMGRLQRHLCVEKAALTLAVYSGSAARWPNAGLLLTHRLRRVQLGQLYRGFDPMLAGLSAACTAFSFIKAIPNKNGVLDILSHMVRPRNTHGEVTIFDYIIRPTSKILYFVSNLAWHPVDIQDWHYVSLSVLFGEIGLYLYMYVSCVLTS